MSLCRARCAACCIAPSITSAIPGMPGGKPAGVPCLQLTAELQCAIFGLPERPAFCKGLQPEPSMCCASREEALAALSELERLTAPDSSQAPVV